MISSVSVKTAFGHIELSPTEPANVAALERADNEKDEERVPSPSLSPTLPEPPRTDVANGGVLCPSTHGPLAPLHHQGENEPVPRKSPVG